MLLLLELTRDTHTPPYLGPLCMEKSCAPSGKRHFVSFFFFLGFFV